MNNGTDCASGSITAFAVPSPVRRVRALRVATAREQWPRRDEAPRWSRQRAPGSVNSRDDVFGGVAARTFHASNSIFTGLVEAVRRQEGVCDFPFFRSNRARLAAFGASPIWRPWRQRPGGAPRRGKSLEHRRSAPLSSGDGGRGAAQFTATRYGAPAFVQLAARCRPSSCAPARTMKQRWARFMSCTSHSVRPTSGSAWTSTSAWV